MPRGAKKWFGQTSTELENEVSFPPDRFEIYLPWPLSCYADMLKTAVEVVFRFGPSHTLHPYLLNLLSAFYALTALTIPLMPTAKILSHTIAILRDKTQEFEAQVRLLYFAQHVSVSKTNIGVKYLMKQEDVCPVLFGPRPGTVEL